MEIALNSDTPGGFTHENGNNNKIKQTKKCNIVI